MEYCGGGDLSTIIKQAQRQNKPVSEELIWNYFMQILLALSHCHHPNGHSRSGSSGNEGDRRPQILHRDLKPDNGELCYSVFLYLCLNHGKSFSTRITKSNLATLVFPKLWHRPALLRLMLACVWQSSGYFQQLILVSDTLLHVSRTYAGKSI